MVCVILSFIYLSCSIFGIEIEKIVKYSPVNLGIGLLIFHMIVLIVIDIIVDSVKKENCTKTTTTNGPIYTIPDQNHLELTEITWINFVIKVIYLVYNVTVIFITDFIAMLAVIIKLLFECKIYLFMFLIVSRVRGQVKRFILT